MLDISLGEFILIALVAMAFLGPERIPVMARKIGEFVHMVKDAFMQVREEVIKDEETASVFNEMQQTVQDIANAVNVRKAVREIGQPLFTASPRSTPEDQVQVTSDSESPDSTESIEPENNSELEESDPISSPENDIPESSFSMENHGFSTWVENLSREIPFKESSPDNSDDPPQTQSPPETNPPDKTP
ncbi:hypothetical protein KKF34_09975 [Myxococcota bacterium]|nr:hypothetical protein [Myxococcota bacterium]MBU1383171.1 hypothetical protein [Myxococcota bacterium]MBU1497193.1 hypothetical protein [Myxococcota bacterium]